MRKDLKYRKAVIDMKGIYKEMGIEKLTKENLILKLLRKIEILEKAGADNDEIVNTLKIYLKTELYKLEEEE